MGLGVLPLGGNGDIAEGLVTAEVLERVDHVGLEIIPAEAELLSISISHLGWKTLDFFRGFLVK